MKKKKRKLRRNDAIERALGAAQREQYLKENPHGYSKSKSIHKDKNQYSRKRKHKNKGFSDKDSGRSFFIPMHNCKPIQFFFVKIAN